MKLLRTITQSIHLILSGLSPRQARIAVGAVSAVMIVFLALPVIALVGRVRLGNPAPSMLSALGLSLATTLASLMLIVLLGTPLAYTFARYHFPFKRLLNVLVEMPIVMPPIVAGLALLVQHALLQAGEHFCGTSPACLRGAGCRNDRQPCECAGRAVSHPACRDL